MTHWWQWVLAIGCGMLGAKIVGDIAWSAAFAVARRWGELP